MPQYIANVLIAFNADSEGDACDAVSAMLSENLIQSKALLDWSYVEKYPKGGHTRPIPLLYELPQLDDGTIEETDLNLSYEESRRAM